jgi:hypothetical protein
VNVIHTQFIVTGKGRGIFVVRALALVWSSPIESRAEAPRHDSSSASAGREIRRSSLRSPDVKVVTLERIVTLKRKMPAACVALPALAPVSFSPANSFLLDEVSSSSLSWRPHRGPL